MISTGTAPTMYQPMAEATSSRMMAVFRRRHLERRYTHVRHRCVRACRFARTRWARAPNVVKVNSVCWVRRINGVEEVGVKHGRKTYGIECCWRLEELGGMRGLCLLRTCDRSFVENHAWMCCCNNNHQVEVRAAAAVAKPETTFAINMTTKISSNDRKCNVRASDSGYARETRE